MFRHWILVFQMLAVAKQYPVSGSVLKADAVPSQCLVEIEGKPILKNLGETWTTNDLCVHHVCVADDHGNPLEKLVNKSCPLDCEDGYELRKDPEQCCSECVQVKCKYKDRTYNIGDNWKAEDSCTLFECSEMHGKPMISTFKKLCPKLGNCLEEDVYDEDCCPKCRTQKSEYDSELNTDIRNENTYKYHPCNRECKLGEPPKICKYTFVAEWYETLSKACFDCPYNVSDCFLPHCIVADGIRRSVLVVNRMMPGPSIEVCLNDTVMVDVKNHLMGESTTIHWHGLHQRGTPYMDGVPHISQCPIQPHTTFRYTFRADHAGTHFWHSHTGMQRGDGSFGSLIIRQPQDPQSNLYDFDLSDHVIIVQDWAHIPGTSMFSSHHHSIGDNKPPNILVNGKGRYDENEMKKTTDGLVTSSTSESSTEIVPTTTPSISSLNNEAEAYTTAVEEESHSWQPLGTMPPEIDFVHLIHDSNMKIQNEPSEVVREKRSLEAPLMVPLAKFNVVKGYKYRFRLINAEFLNCPISISVDNHTVLVINSDGYDFEPVEVTSLATYAGERFDFILEATQEIGNYWIRFKGLMDCDLRFTAAHQAAILHYEGANNNDPDGTPSYDFEPGGIQLNALNTGPGHADSLTITELDAISPDDDWLFRKEPDYKFYVYYDFYPKDNPHFHVPNLYGFNQVTKTNGNKLFTPQLNHISLKFPSSPLMTARDQLDESQFCNESSLAAKGIDCKKDFCECSHVLQVPLDSIVEMVLIDEGVTYDANHPFHLHGNAFRVIGMDKVAANVTAEMIKAMDRNGQLKRKLKNAPIKDTITIPDGGYTIIRFKADNPGYWLFHCHIEFHAEIGMALVLKVGDHNQMDPVPRNFPTCSDYVPEIRANDGSGAAIRLNLSLLLLLFGLILVHL